MEAVSIAYGTLAIEIGCVLILLTSFCGRTVFPFPPSTDKLLGDWHVNRQGAPNFSVRFPNLN
jgi:hypothetical protein